MKKIILTGAAFAFFAATLVSCGETKDTTAETPKETAGTTAPEVVTPEATPAGDAPSFSSEEVNKGLADFKTLKNDYVKAIESKDQAKINEFTTKYTTWSQSAASWATKLKPEEAQAFSEYMTKLSQEWGAAAQAAATK